MALSLKTDGLSTPNLVDHTWWDDYYDLLTGTMHDQAVTFNYRPGSSSVATLTLKGDGTHHLLYGYQSDDTTHAFHFDAAGNLALAGTGTSGGFTLARLRAKGTGVTAGVNIWVALDGDDPTSGDGLQEGDIVFSVS